MTKPAQARPQPNGKAASQPEYVDPVAIYEQALAAIQNHDYSRAAALLGAVLTDYPEEKELHERAKLYLNICQKHLAPSGGAPATHEERLFAATVAINSGAYDQALLHLRAAVDEQPADDYALYMLAVVLALRDEQTEAVPVLLRAIELNPDNRAIARQDPDLQSLREHEGVRAVLHAAITPKVDRHRHVR